MSHFLVCLSVSLVFNNQSLKYKIDYLLLLIKNPDLAKGERPAGSFFCLFYDFVVFSVKKDPQNRWLV